MALKNGLRIWLSTLGVPMALVLGVVTLVPIEGPRHFGISLRSWALFACAPTISLILAIASTRIGRGSSSSDRRY